MCDGLSAANWQISSARSVSMAVMPSHQSVVDPDLVRGQRLHLHDLACSSRTDEPHDDVIGLVSVARPVHNTTCLLHSRLEVEQVAVEMTEHALLDRFPGVAQRLPIRSLTYDRRPLAANRRRRDEQVSSELPILQRETCRLGKALLHVVSRARISAMCRVCTSIRRRERAPPICARHDESTAVTTPAPDSATA